MWIFGHLGIGSKLAAPLARKLSYRWILIGTVLPDLIDKPLYYGLAALTGERGSAIGLVSCTRTFGHTAIFAVALTAIAAKRKSVRLAALALGVATHLILDGCQDIWFREVMGIEGESSLRLAALFPFYAPRFGEMPFESFGAHFRSGARAFTITTEIVGLAIIGWDFLKTKRRLKRPRRSESP